MMARTECPMNSPPVDIPAAQAKRMCRCIHRPSRYTTVAPASAMRSGEICIGPRGKTISGGNLIADMATATNGRVSCMRIRHASDATWRSLCPIATARPSSSGAGSSGWKITL